MPDAALAPGAYRVRPGDTLSILVCNQAKMPADPKVRSDGQVTLPPIGDIAGQGRQEEVDTPPGVGQRGLGNLDAFC